jgi:hypothetical protein
MSYKIGDDKSKWGPGPWQAEPDSLEWTDEATGFQCKIKRNGLGALCGYVGVPDPDGVYNASYNELENIVSCHGGLTCGYQRDGTTWLGFDCCHAGDLVPEMNFLGIAPGQDYRDIAYVKSEVETLAKQLAGGCSV